MKKEFQYIFLQSKKSFIFGNDDGTATLYKELVTSDGIGCPLEIYFLSDDEIKENDWYISFGSGCGNGQLLKASENHKYPNEYAKSLCKKIIATTNTQLHTKKNSVHNENSYMNDVPKISQSDTEYIISLHNGKVNRINVERLADIYLNEFGKTSHATGRHGGFIDGYKRCLSDNAEKKWTDENVKNILREFDRWSLENEIHSEENWVDSFWESQSKPHTKEESNKDTVIVEYEGKIGCDMKRIDYPGNLDVELKLKDGNIVIVR